MIRSGDYILSTDQKRAIAPCFSSYNCYNVAIESPNLATEVFTFICLGEVRTKDKAAMFLAGQEVELLT